MDKQYKTCYIAFLDMLGFKNLIKRSECQDIWEIYTNIKNPIKKIYVGDENGKAKAIDAAEAVNIKVMSDSICFYVDASLPNALFCLLMSCAAFQDKLLTLPEPVLIRGAITVGNLFAEGDITYGPGLTEAYLMEEKSAKYPRIIITKNTLEHGMENTDVNGTLNVFDPVFCDFDDFYTVDYIAAPNSSEAERDRWNPVYNYVVNKLSSETDNNIREKYLYLKKRLSVIIK